MQASGHKHCTHLLPLILSYPKSVQVHFTNWKATLNSRILSLRPPYFPCTVSASHRATCICIAHSFADQENDVTASMRPSRHRHGQRCMWKWYRHPPSPSFLQTPPAITQSTSRACHANLAHHTSYHTPHTTHHIPHSTLSTPHSIVTPDTCY